MMIISSIFYRRIQHDKEWNQIMAYLYYSQKYQHDIKDQIKKKKENRFIHQRIKTY